MIDQCIYEVYKRDKKVLIPDFGAFFYSESTNKVNFNDLLNFDDGKVVKEIQKQQFLSEEGARKALEQYVWDIKNILDQGKLLFFGGIGYLFKDDNGAFSIQKTKPATESKIIEEPSESVSTVENENPEQINDSDFLSENHKGIDLLEAEEELLNIHDSSREIENHTYQESILTNKEESDYLQEEPELGNFMISDDKNRFKYEDDIKINYNTPKKKSTFKKVMLVIIPLVLIATAVYYYFYNNAKDKAQSVQYKHKPLVDSQTMRFSEKNQSTEDNFAGRNTETTASDQQSNPSSPKSNIVVNPQNTYELVSDENKTYSLILGSFKIERNADNYQHHLQSHGIEVIKFRGKSNFYFVGYQKIKGKSNAVKLLMEIKEENPNAWIINKELLSL